MQRRGIRDVFVVVWSHSRQSTEGIMCPCISLLSRHAQEGGMSCSFEPSHLAQTTSHFLRSGSWGPCAHDKVSRVPSASAWKCRGANLVFQLAIGVGFAAACGESCHCVAGLAIPSPCYIRPSFRYFLQCTVCLCVLVHRLRGLVTCRVSKCLPLPSCRAFRSRDIDRGVDIMDAWLRLCKFRPVLRWTPIACFFVSTSRFSGSHL